MPQAPLTSPPAKTPEAKNDATSNLGEYKRALQDVRLWVDDAAHAAASRGKDHLAEALKETKRVLDEKMLTSADVEKAMREAFAPLRDKLLPTLAGLKNTLGPLPIGKGRGWQNDPRRPSRYRGVCCQRAKGYRGCGMGLQWASQYPGHSGGQHADRPLQPNHEYPEEGGQSWPECPKLGICPHRSH